MVDGLMAKFTIGKNFDKYITSLENLKKMSPHICGKAVYEGAKIVADAAAQSAASLKVTNAQWGGNYKGQDQGMQKGITAAQKAGLQSSRNGGGLGISKMQNDGGLYHVKLGYHGYNSQVTKKYPKGQPNAMIARSLESGTSFRKKDPFISRAVRKTRAQAEQKMAQVVDEETAKIMK